MDEELASLIDAMKGRVGLLADEYSGGGLTVGDWYDAMSKVIAQYTIDAYTTARKTNWAALPEHEKEQVWNYIGHQLGFLETFADQLETRYADKPAALSARSKLYASSIKGPWWEGNTYGIPLPAMPGDGTSQCLGHCHCSWKIVPVGEDSYDCYWELGVGEEHCQTCVARATRWSPLRVRDGTLVATKSYDPTSITLKKWSDAARAAALAARRAKMKGKVKKSGGGPSAPLSPERLTYMKTHIGFGKTLTKFNKANHLTIQANAGAPGISQSTAKKARTLALKEIDKDLLGTKNSYDLYDKYVKSGNYSGGSLEYYEKQRRAMARRAEALTLAKQHIQSLEPAPAAKQPKKIAPKPSGGAGAAPAKSSGLSHADLQTKVTDLQHKLAVADTPAKKYYYNKQLKLANAELAGAGIPKQAGNVGPAPSKAKGPVPEHITKQQKLVKDLETAAAQPGIEKGLKNYYTEQHQLALAKLQGMEAEHAKAGQAPKQKGASKYPTLDAYKKGQLTTDQVLGQLKQDIAAAKAAGDKTTAVTLTSQYYAIKGKAKAADPTGGTTVTGTVSPGVNAALNNAKAVAGGKHQTITPAPTPGPKSLGSATSPAADLYSQWSNKTLSYYSYHKKLNQLAAQHGVDAQQLHEAGKAHHKAVKSGKGPVPTATAHPTPTPTPTPSGGGQPAAGAPKPSTAAVHPHTSAKEWYNKYINGDIDQKEYYASFGALAKAQGQSVPDFYKAAGITPPTWQQQGAANTKWHEKHPPPPPPPPPPAPHVTATHEPGATYTQRYGTEAEAWGQTHSKDWVDGLTTEERNAVGSYTGSGYGAINHYLRGFAQPTNKALKEIKEIDTALAKSQAKENFRAFRGFNHDKLHALMESGANLNGTTFRDKGVISTSIDSNRAFKYPIRFNINVPKGSRGAYVQTISSVPHELEWLIPRNASFVIKGYKKVTTSHGSFFEAEVDYVGSAVTANLVE